MVKSKLSTTIIMSSISLFILGSFIFWYYSPGLNLPVLEKLSVDERLKGHSLDPNKVQLSEMRHRYYLLHIIEVL